MSFHIDGWMGAVGAALFSVLLMGKFWRRKPSLQGVPFPSLKLFPHRTATRRLQLASLPRQLLQFACVVLFFAALDPHLIVERPMGERGELSLDQEEQKTELLSLPTEGIALYLLLDRSGSMAEPISYQRPSGRWVKGSRMDALKEITLQFILGNEREGLTGRPHDMIGVVGFARTAQILSPLTLDHRHLVEVLSDLEPVRRQEEDGTAMGYAIYKTAHLIGATKHFAQELQKEGKPAYSIQSQAIILVTDGFHHVHPDDGAHPKRSSTLDEAAAFARDLGIKLYVVNIEPAIAQPRFFNELDRLRRAAELTGGTLFVVGQQGSLAEIYAQINQLEASSLPGGKQVLAEVQEKSRERVRALETQKWSWLPYLMFLAMVAVASAVVLETTYLRRIP